MNPLAKNFDVKANVDDGVCHVIPETGKIFGGLFQTCTMASTDAGDVCNNGYANKNPLTGDFSCPVGYQTVLLHTTPLSAVQTHSVCHGFWFWRRCHDESKYSSGSYSVYWCSPKYGSPIQRYVFGGIYTDIRPNILTGK